MGNRAEARAAMACSWVGKTMDAIWQGGGGCPGNAGRQQCWKGSPGVVGRGVEDDGTEQQLQGHPPGILGGRGDGCGHHRGKSPWKPPKVRPNTAPCPGSPASPVWLQSRPRSPPGSAPSFFCPTVVLAVPLPGATPTLTGHLSERPPPRPRMQLWAEGRLSGLGHQLVWLGHHHLALQWGLSLQTSVLRLVARRGSMRSPR